MLRLMLPAVDSSGPGSPGIAAFFDLDKTIIAKSSAFVFSRAFFQEGLINRRAVLKSTYAQFMYLLAGADAEQMERMRAHITAQCADRKSTRLNSSHANISYAVFCLKKKKK